MSPSENERPRVRGRGGIERKGSRECLDRVSALYGDPLCLAQLAADDLRQHLRDYADATDNPSYEAVEAADLLDAVADLLAKAMQP